MQINLQITFDDATEKLIQAGAPEIVAFETKFDKPISSLQEDPRFTYLVFMAWHAESRTKSTALSFEEWTNTITGIRADEAKK